MEELKRNQRFSEEEEYTFRNALKKRKQDLFFLWSHKFKIMGICILGALLGFLIAWKWPVSYTARLTFVVEEGKTSGGGLISSLAGSIGLDIGSLAGGTGGVLAGDNVQQLLISQRMLKQTLLTPYNSKQTLADRYVEVYKLNNKWKKYNNDRPVYFPADASKYTRLQDSLIHEILKNNSEKEVSVSKPDKKLSFFALNTTMKDEKLASLFCERLINEASTFYIATKTKRLRNNVNLLQHRADSIGRILNRRTYSSAAATQALVDVNPAYTTAAVPSELQERDKRVMQTYYGEIIKNLEVSRTALIQETPTFQIVDTPELPLRKNRLKYSTAGLFGILLAGGLYCVFLFYKRSNAEESLAH